EGHKAPKRNSWRNFTPRNSPGGEFSVVYAGPLTRPFVLRLNLPGGKFWVVLGGVVFCFCLAAKTLFAGLLGRWRGLSGVMGCHV
ncbi:hypothetical protein ACIG8S_30080, partial [[Kitasatospora] papulosa]|uniref:hypothetical protein n=1 Tax=[Kitasatospora] papulosa TaxID=1464011 RepID=UPI0037D4D867